MTEYFLRSDLPSMRIEAGAGGEAFQSAPVIAAVGSRSPLCAPVHRSGGERFSEERLAATSQ